MTDFDKKLIERADRLSRYEYREIDSLIKLAETEEARQILTNIRWELYDLVVETI